jgi:hypothetical protein
MNEFEMQLLRLKEATRTMEDQGVAALLGLSKAAFSDRKKRGSFPTKEVFALASQKPELGLDADWIVTGVSSHFETQVIAERHLVECYRIMNSVDKKALSRFASALSGVAEIPSDKITAKLNDQEKQK